MIGNYTEKERVAIQAIAAGIVMLIGLVKLRNAKKTIDYSIELLAGIGAMTTAPYKPTNYYRKK